MRMRTKVLGGVCSAALAGAGFAWFWPSDAALPQTASKRAVVAPTGTPAPMPAAGDAPLVLAPAAAPRPKASPPPSAAPVAAELIPPPRPPGIDDTEYAQMIELVKRARRPASVAEPYADAPSPEEVGQGFLSKYFESWKTEREDTASTQRAREWLAGRMRSARVPTYGLDVSCRQTLCRIRVAVSQAQEIAALGRLPLPNDKRIIMGDPFTATNGELAIVAYHPIPAEGLSL